MQEQKIIVQPTGTLNQDDRLALATLLIKAGYEVSIRKEKHEGQKNAVIVLVYKAQSAERLRI